MICKKCGTENEEDNAFCMNCGSPLGETESTEPVAEETVVFEEAGDEDGGSTKESIDDSFTEQAAPIPSEPELVTETPSWQAPEPVPDQPAPQAPAYAPMPIAPMPPQPEMEYTPPPVAPQAPKGPPDTCRTLRLPVAPDMPGLSFFDGTTGQYFGYMLLFGFLNILIVALPIALSILFGGVAVTSGSGTFDKSIMLDLSDLSVLYMILLGLAAFFALLLSLLVLAWLYTVLIRWMSHHTIVNDHRLVFVGHSFDLFKKLILYFLLCSITAGIFSIWVPVKLLKWKASNTRFAT